MSKPLPKHEHLKLVVEHMRANGYRHKLHVVLSHGRFVFVRASNANGEVMNRQVHRINNVGSSQDQAWRGRVALAQYDHWLDWVKLKIEGKL